MTTLVLAPRCESNSEDLRDLDGVFKEEFIEIAHAEEQHIVCTSFHPPNRTLVLFFEFEVLLQCRSQLLSIHALRCDEIPLPLHDAKTARQLGNHEG